MTPTQAGPLPLAACADVGGSKILAGLVEPTGRVLAQARWPAEKGQPLSALVLDLRDRLRALAAQSGIDWGRVTGVGYSTAGMMDVHSGVVFASPTQGVWQDVPLTALLQAAFGLPAWIEMDAVAAALGEAWLGAGTGTDYFVHVIAGTGIGAGILVHGEPLRGWRGTAGEFGHTVIDPRGPLCNCGGRGCLEALAAGPAIARRARELLQQGEASLLGKLPEISAAEVFSAARQDDALATQVVAETVEALATGLANLVHLLNPRVIALGGGVALGGADLLLDPLRAATYRRCGSWVDTRNTLICLAQLGEQAGLLGAASLVWKAQHERT